jgi:acyl CoA:acetate/3-ketoacid CoA transferase alpha subunit
MIARHYQKKPRKPATLEGLMLDGITICLGGFDVCGIPARLINAIVASEVKDVTIPSNNADLDEIGLRKPFHARQVNNMAHSYVGRNNEFASEQSYEAKNAPRSVIKSSKRS